MAMVIDFIDDPSSLSVLLTASLTYVVSTAT